MNDLPSLNPPLERSPQALFKQIFQAKSPDQFVRSIPSQNLFLAIRDQGLSSSTEVIELLSPQQLQVVLDFDLWSRDELDEERIWQWLELPDVANDLTLLQRVLQSIDLKLIALLICRYVQVVVTDEATDPPPDDGFHSPDKGNTWIKVTIEDTQKEFLLKRLLALIFETKAELYYQLLQIPTVSTQSTLQEQSYQEKAKRLLSEGIPDDTWAAEMNNPLSLSTASKKLDAAETDSPIEDIFIIPTFLHAHIIPEPLRSFLASIKEKEPLEREITLLVNSAIVFFRVPAWESEEVQLILEQVRGAMNIGLERILESSPSSSYETIFEILRLRGMYQVGLESIFPLRSKAQKVPEDSCQNDPRLLTLKDALSAHFPKLPAFVNDDGTLEVSDDRTKLASGYRALQSLGDIHVSEVLLAQITADL